MSGQLNNPSGSRLKAIVDSGGIAEDITPLIDRRGVDTEVFIDSQPDKNSASYELPSDTHQTHVLHRTALGGAGNLKEGRIHYVFPYANWYCVAVEGGDGLLPCVKMTAEPSSTLGVSDKSVIATDTRVFINIHQAATFGVILGVIPDQVENSNFVFPDSVSQGSPVGVKREEYYTQYLELLGAEGGVRDHSNGRPIDELQFDWGKITELGSGIHIDPFMQWFRIDETTGIWGFHHDQTLKVRGNNLNIESSCHTEEFRNDEGELTQFRGESPYPWEILGVPEFKSEASRTEDGDGVHWTLPYSKYEPAVDDQQPFYRYQEYGGYLGQGKIRSMVLWPQGADRVADLAPSDPNCPDEPLESAFGDDKYPNEYLTDKVDKGRLWYKSEGGNPPKSSTATGKAEVRTYDSLAAGEGVFREQISFDGHYAVESAKGIVIAKRSIIPVPKRRYPNDDQTSACDSVENANYMFAGRHETGPDTLGDGNLHKVGDIKNCEEERSDQALLSAAAVLDMHAHLFNWKGPHAFHYHWGDYFVSPEELSPLGTCQFIPEFSKLETASWLDRPEAKGLYVDHRYNGGRPVNYYSVLSHLTLTEDGAVVIQGGQGEEIRMVGGSIQMSCPGNIYLQPGKQLVAMAGDDVIVKARKSVDISSSTNDVRIKAEKHLQLLSGNGGEGHTMIENRGTTKYHNFKNGDGGEDIESGGIILRAPKSDIATMAENVYLRTGSSDGGINGGGQIMLDADKGNGRINTYSGSFTRFLKSSAEDSFGPSPKKPRAVNSYAGNLNTFGSSVAVNGGVTIWKDLLVGTQIQIVNGEISTQNGNHVGRIRDHARLNALIELVHSEATEDNSLASSHFNQFVESIWHASKKIGSKSIQESAMFSCRTEKQYGTGKFKLPECHWQILNAAGPDAGVSWTEPTVKFIKDDRMPWPGLNKWQTEKTFLRMPKENFTMYDVANGYSRDIPYSDDTPIYEDAQYGGFKPDTMDKYKVIEATE